jgi:lipoprotein-anchoring transpeptidase ErfK/SrfK
MSFPRVILLGSLAVFVVIGVMAMVKKMGSHSEPAPVSIGAQAPVVQALKVEELPVSPPVAVAKKEVEQKLSSLPKESLAPQDDFPVVDRMIQLFTTGPTKLPIVETLTYASSVPWLKGRPAWVADYAAHYATSRHFIARSLNGKADYLSQKVSTGSRFNVFRKDKNINFYLLIDLSRCKMGFYYVDLDTHERVLLKTYSVGLGRIDPQTPSGSLTPTGRYSLGGKVAIYKPGVMGLYQDKQTEMITVFGTRWIPFDQEFEGSTAIAKGYGIHGAPWYVDAKTGQWVENRDCIGTPVGDGCIRLALEDIEEVFSIVITKPTFVEIVKDFHDAKLPGVEVATPTR